MPIIFVPLLIKNCLVMAQKYFLWYNKFYDTKKTIHS